MQCPYCFSSHVTIVSSHETQDVIVIHCANCGKTAEIDVEHVPLDRDDIPHG